MRSNVLPPNLSNIAFIGQHASFAHVLTASLESRWLAGVLSGEVALPPKEAQLQDIAQQQASAASVWKRMRSPLQRRCGVRQGGCGVKGAAYPAASRTGDRSSAPSS